MKGLAVLFLLLAGGCVVVNARPAVDADNPVASEKGTGFSIFKPFANWFNGLIHRYNSINFDEDVTANTSEYYLQPEDMARLLSMYTPPITEQPEMLTDEARADVQNPASENILAAMKEDGLRLADIERFGKVDNTTSTTTEPTTIPSTTTAATTLPTTTTEVPTTTEEPPTTTTTATEEIKTTQASSEFLGNSISTPSPQGIPPKELMTKFITNLEHLSAIERKLEKKKQAESEKEESYLSSLTATLKDVFTTFWPYLPISVFLIAVIACLIAYVQRRRYSKAHDLKHDLDASGFPNKEVVI